MDFLDGMKTDGRERTYADKDHEIPNGTKMRGHLLMQGCEAVSLEVAPEAPAPRPRSLFFLHHGPVLCVDVHMPGLAAP